MKDVVWRYELGYNGIGWGVFGGVVGTLGQCG